ncbi:unnamed protein product [Durusdinium trenchii]|uniref:Protein kinase domain-containing protein n=1 Tax=Durusdinium trenchii TaxID=1381693 RepID=A0ABP0MMV6_9DINO
MGSCVATLRGARKVPLESQRLKSQKEDKADLLEEIDEVPSFAIYIIDNKGDIEDFYDVEDTKIGEGSFGRVCRCTNKSTGAERAVKMLRKVRRKSQLIMFQNELSTLKMLDHPHIVKLYEHFEDKRYMYMVMEYCRGGELFDRLLEVGHFTENQACSTECQGLVSSGEWDRGTKSRQREKLRENERVETVMDRNAGAAASERAEAAASQGGGDWFAGCVPLACLGQEEDLRQVLKMLFWRSLGRDLSGVQALSPSSLDSEIRVVRLFGPQPPGPLPLKPLDEEVFEDLGRGPFDVVAVTDKPERAHALVASLKWPLRLRLLQPPAEERPWRYRWFDSERYLLSYVTRLTRAGLGDRLVIYSDAFDTAFLDCQRNLNKVLEELKRPIFFGVEFDLYPAGLFGYPAAAAGSHSRARLNTDQLRKKPMPRCREVRFVELIWEPRPADDHEPCLAWSEVGGLMSSGSESAQPVAGEYLNGGFYGGRAADLEVALRKLLHLQGRLPEVNARGEAYQNHGKTHQYLWNQYLIEHPEQVTLDYGGAFVVNLARRSISPRQFGKDEMGSIKSVLFQKAVCFIHANAGGFADMTFHLLRVAHLLKADSTRWAGFQSQQELEEAAQRGLQADKSKADRLSVDLSLCFRGFPLAPVWQGLLSYLFLVTPYNAATFNGMQFFIARPLERTPQLATFEIVALQRGIVQTRRETGRAKPPNGTHEFEGRNRFDTQVFQMDLRSGDCLAWRCFQRCDLTFAELETQAFGESPPSQRLGTWSGLGKDLVVGARIALTTWLPRRYAIGAQAEIRGFNFYQD